MYILYSFNKVLDAAGIEHQTHLFLEGEDAPAEAVASLIARVCKEVECSILTAARSHKVKSPNGFICHD